jgi:hypothetical protein
MSPNTNPVANEYDVVPVEGLPEGLPGMEQPAEQPVEQPVESNKKQKKEKNLLRRLCGLLLVVLCAVPFLMSVPYVVGKTVANATLLTIVKELFASEKALLVLPVLGWTGNALGKISALGVYALLGGAIIAIVCGLFAFLFGKKAPLRVSAFFATAMYIVYALSVMLVSRKLEVVLIALSLVGALIYTLISFKTLECKKAAWKAAFNALFCGLVSLGLVVCTLYYISAFNKGLNALKISSLCRVIKAVIVIVAALYVVVATVRMQTTKGGKFNFALSFVTLFFSILCLVLGLAGKGDAQFYLIAAAGATVISLIQVIVGANKYRVPKEKEEKEEVVEAVEEEFVREEFAEAVTYEGGPVEGVALAEEVVPTFSPEEPKNITRTEGYNFLNCQSFDPFMASLNDEERYEFTELFIMRIKGIMPEIPNYKVGSEDYNKEFFRKWFIYLGQYRDRISDNLLAKIYKFSIKIQ